jgi:hypothetical protein
MVGQKGHWCKVRPISDVVLQMQPEANGSRSSTGGDRICRLGSSGPPASHLEVARRRQGMKSCSVAMIGPCAL